MMVVHIEHHWFFNYFLLEFHLTDHGFGFKKASGTSEAEGRARCMQQLRKL
jgi:hypothetical protein